MKGNIGFQMSKAKKNKKRIKMRNGIAKALQSPTHQQKIIPNKKRKAKNNPKDDDYEFSSSSIWWC